MLVRQVHCVIGLESRPASCYRLIKKWNPLWLIESRLLLTNADLLWVLVISWQSSFITCFSVSVIDPCDCLSAVLRNKVTRNVLRPIRTNTLFFFFQPIIKRKLKQLVTCWTHIFPRIANRLASAACFCSGFLFVKFIVPVDQSNYKKYFQFATKLRSIPRYSLVLAKCFVTIRGRKNIGL